MERLLPLFVAVPLGMGFVMPILDKLSLSRRVADTIALLAALFLVGLSVVLFTGPGGTLVYWVGGWAPPITGIAMVADGLTRLMLFTVALISLIAVVFSTRYMDGYTSRGLYYSLFFLMVTGMNGVIISGDLFNLFVFVEIAAIASYALVGFGCEHEELEAAFKYLVLGSIASAFVLFGIGLLYNITGTLNMAQLAGLINRQGLSPVALLAACLFIAGFGLKAAMVPFHAWLPDAHPSAPAPISAMLSGVLIKAAGVYVICRLLFNVFGVTLLMSYILMGMGAVSMLVGVLLAVGQWDFKRLLAYHSISQMGYVILALGVGGSVVAEGGNSAVAALAVFGGLFHLFNHACFKSLLFLCSGAIEHATGTRQLKEMGGLIQRLPITGGCCRVAALSIAGVPPFNGFWSKLVIIVAVLWAGYIWLGVLTVLVSFLTLLSFVKVQRYALHGELPERYRELREAPVMMLLGLLVLAGVCLLGGVLCPLYKGVLLEPARDVVVNGLQYITAVLGG